MVKNRLLAMLALCGAAFVTATSMWAATEWDDPQMQFVTPNLVEDVSEGGGTYYVYHVATGKFLSNGNWLNNWNTEVEVKDQGQEVTLSWGQDYQLANVDPSDPEYNDAYGWRISMKNAPTNGGFHELFLHPEKKIMCVDHNMQGHILWDIVETAEGSGVYHIKIASSDKLFGEGTETTATTVWGVAEGATGVNPLCDYTLEANLNAGVEWKFVNVAFYEAYQAKKSLKTALEEAVEAGYTAYTDAETVYMDAEATAEEVEEATKALNFAVLQHLYGSASATNPANVTALMVNADFEDGQTGWDFWRESNMGQDNLVVQHNRTDIKDEAGNNVPTFAERWTATNPSNASAITQTIEGLPDGKYRFSAMVAIGGVPEGAAPEGMYFVANGLGAEQRHQITEAVAGTMIAGSIEFSVLGGTATVGLRATNVNFNWYAFAGVKLEYLGTEGAENMLTFLQGCIDNAKAVVSRNVADSLKCSAAGMAKYEEMIAKAEEAVANTSLSEEELQTVALELEARMDSLEADYTAYEQMPEIVISLWDAYDSAPYAYLECMLPYEDYLDETETAIDELAFNYLEKDSINVRANAILTECLRSGLQSGDIDDVTMLIENPTFDSNASGWEGGPGWGNGVAEKYNANFDVYQTLKGLPMGSYKISAQAFYRPALNDVCQQSWDPATEGSDEVTAYLYGNDGMVKLPHLYKHVYDAALSDGTPTDVALSLASDPERDGKYGLNNLKSTAEAFALGDYTTELICYVQEDGELRFGVKTPEDSGIGGRWAAFDNFTITYLGAEDVTGLVYTLQNLVDEAQATYLKWVDSNTDESAYITVANIVALEKAITAATDTLTKDLTLNAYNVCAKALNDAMDNGKDAIEYIRSMEEECNIYLEEIYSGVYADYEAMPEFADFDNMIGTILDNIDAIYDSAEAAEADMLQLDLAYTSMMRAGYDTSGATKDNPVEMTKMIKSAGFSTYDYVNQEEVSTSRGWTSTHVGGEANNNDRTYEFWNADTCDLSQILYNLPVGSYKLTYNGFYRAGGTVDAAIARRDSTESLYARVYASINDGEKTILDTVPSIFTEISEGKYHDTDIVLADSLFPDLGDMLYKSVVNTTAGAEKAFEAGKYAGELYFQKTSESDKVTIGVRKEQHIDDDWLVFDNFRLFYLGEGETNIPDEYWLNQLQQKYAEAKAWADSTVAIQLPAYVGIFDYFETVVDSVYREATTGEAQVELYKTAIAVIETALGTAQAGDELAVLINKCATAVTARPDTALTAAINEALEVVAEASYNTAEIYQYAKARLQEAYDLYLAYVPEVSLTIHMDEPNTLYNKIVSQVDNIDGVVGLTLIGTMGDADFEIIRNLPNIRTVDLSQTTVTYLPGWAFNNARNLQTCILPETLETIGECAFQECSSLKNLTIPENVVCCGDLAFNYTGLDEIVCKAVCPPFVPTGRVFNVNQGYTPNLYVPIESKEAYANAAGWSQVEWMYGTMQDYDNINVHQDMTLNLSHTVASQPDLSLMKLQDDIYGNITYGALTVQGNDLDLNKYMMEYDYFSGFQNDKENSYTTLINNTNIFADSIQIKINLMANEWAFLSFPYDVKVSDIKSLNGDVNWVIRKYDGEARAAQQMNNTWVDMTEESILQAGVGYIWQSAYLDSYNNAFIVPAMDNANKNLIFANSERSVALADYPAESNNDRSWNLVGNPFPSYYDTRWMEFTAPITVWNEHENTYEAYSLTDDAYILRPGEAFFVQRPADTESISFPTEGRQTTRVAAENTVVAGANIRTLGTQRSVFNLYLTDGTRTDRTRFVINEQAKAGYDIHTDAGKFMSSDKSVAQLYTIEDGANLSINERPLGNGLIALGAYFGETGTYTLTLDTDNNADVYIVDRQTGKEVDMTNGAYTFEAEAGANVNRFMVKIGMDATCIESSVAGEVKVTTTAGRIIVEAPQNVRMAVYAVDGTMVGRKEAAGASFDVVPGVYMVNVEGAVYKVTVNR